MFSNRIVVGTETLKYLLTQDWFNELVARNKRKEEHEERRRTARERREQLRKNRTRTKL